MLFQIHFDILILLVFLFAFLWLKFLLPLFFSFFLSADSLWKFHYKSRNKCFWQFNHRCTFSVDYSPVARKET